MPNLLVEPRPTNCPAWRPYRGKPFTRSARRVGKAGFIAQLQPSTSSHKLRTNSERTIYNLLVDQGVEPQIEPFAFRISRGGSANGRVGWFVPDMYIPFEDEDGIDDGSRGIYIEVTLATDLTNKLHKVRFVAEKYGKMVILITRDNIREFIANPELLLQQISEAMIEEFKLDIKIETAVGKIDSTDNYANLGTIMPPRTKSERARKPKKGRRVDPHKVAKASTKPSRDPQRRAARRALRRQARELGKSIPQIKRERVMPFQAIVTRDDVPTRIYGRRGKRPKTSAGPQRTGDRLKTKIYLNEAA